MIEIQIECLPVPWVAPTKGRNGFYDKKSKEKQATIWQIRSQYKGPILTVPVVLEFFFFIPIPKRTTKKDRALINDYKLLPTSPDTTNMQKLYEDCLQGIVIQNDRLSNKITSVRYYSERPGITIRIRTWQEELKQKKETYEPRST